MSSDLERRLSQILDDLPRPSAGAEESARRAALAVLPRVRPHRFRLPRRTLALAGATALVLAAGAAAVAAIGGIQVRLGGEKRVQHRAAAQQLALPSGARGLSVFAGGRLWLSTRTPGGVQIQGLGVSAAAVSPRALFVAVGLGNSLVAMAPSRRTAWVHRTPGRVVAASWSPDGLRIAYVVARRRPAAARGTELHLIEGDGDRDRLVDAGLAAVTPSWRADSLAFAYVGAGGRAIVYDLGHRSRRVLEPPPGCGAIRRLSFAPSGHALALVSRSRVLLDTGRARLACSTDPGIAAYSDLTWISRGEFVVSGRPARLRAPYLRRWLVLRGRTLGGGASACTRSPVVALSASPEVGRLAFAALNSTGDLDIETLRSDSKWGDCPQVRSRPLLHLPGVPARVQLSVR